MASVSDVIKYCQHALEKYPNDEQKILKCIDKLFHLDVTVQHLQETGIGRTVNALRKEPGDVGQASRALVYKWKVMVAAEESDQEGDHRNDTSNYNGHISERDSEDSTPKPKNRNDHYVKSSKSSKSLNDEKHKHLNGDSSGSKRRYQYSEEQEPDTKKSKQSRSSDDRHKRKPIKNEPSESETQDTDISQTDDSESETSQSSGERSMEKNKVKEEKEDKHKSSYLSKPTSHHSHKSNSAPEKVRESSERHSKHKSESRKSEKSLPEEKSNDYNKQSSSKGKENSSSKKVKSDNKMKENEKKSNESSSKHSSKKEHSGNTDKHKDHSEKHMSGKHKTSIDKTEKDKTKSSSSKDTSSDRHRSRESSSTKHSSSTKDKSNEKHVSSKESDHSSKTEKKLLSDSGSKYLKNEEIVKNKKDGERSSDRKKRHSSSSKSSKSSSSKKTDDTPKKKLQISNSEDSDDGIDCGSGASFAEALGMISPAKPKKKSTIKEINSPTMFADLSPASLLAPSAKLAPLPALEISALPEISPNYKPRPPPKLLPHFTDEDAMNHVISSKNQRTKVYSGNKVLGKIPTLYELCVNILQEHIDALEYTGGVPYDILKPVIDKATPQQLFMLEHYNPYLMEETDHLWQKFCEKHFRNKQRQEMETWREMYMRCQEEQEHRLKSLTTNIRIAQEAKKAPIKQTKMAYVDTIVKPPRNVLRKQALHGTAHASTASPAARVASLAAAPNVLRGGSVRPPPAAPVSTSAFNKPKKAPLMQKALQFFRGRKR